MSIDPSSAEAQAVIHATVAENAASVAPPAADLTPQPGAAPAAVDTAALLARLQALEEQNSAAQAKAAADAKAAEPKPPVLDEVITALAGVAPGVVHALQVIAQRLDAAGL